MKDFIRTKSQAEVQYRMREEQEINKLRQEQVFTGVNHIQISLEELLETIQLDDKQKVHVDNIYYHLGALKGCCE